MGPLVIIPGSGPSPAEKVINAVTCWHPPIGVDRTNESLDQLTLDFSGSQSPSASEGSRVPGSQLPGNSPGLQRGPRISSLPEETAHPAPAGTPGADDHTAIYDIASRTVYLPDGHRLEAHSGLGGRLDDPRYVDVKGRGPTPPNVYNLVLRDQLFHGVRAIRLIPVDDQKMFGRNGILAHSYMLGPSGQSNGCVSFRHYREFLNAFLRGAVDRLVVVGHRAAATSVKASALSVGSGAASRG
jgi:hypothetical protein